MVKTLIWMVNEQTIMVDIIVLFDAYLHAILSVKILQMFLEKKIPILLLAEIKWNVVMDK